MTKPIDFTNQANTTGSDVTKPLNTTPDPSSQHQKEPLFIAVEGPIGVGKTTLTKLLTKKLEATCLKEIIEENPYLKKFYENIEEYAFQTEMFFLCNRIKQLEDTQYQKLDKGLSVVADYSIIKNYIFAGLTLKPDHFQKYEKVFEILTKDLPQPDIIIYLHGDVDLLMKRIALRDRPFERNMSRDYMEKLSVAYDRYFSSEDIEPSIDNFEPSSEQKHLDPNSSDQPSIVQRPTAIISIDIQERDFVNRPEDVVFLMEEITKIIHQRRIQSCSPN